MNLVYTVGIYARILSMDQFKIAEATPKKSQEKQREEKIKRCLYKCTHLFYGYVISRYMDKFMLILHLQQIYIHTLGLR